MAFLGLDKIGKFFSIIRHNGGVLKSLKRLYLTDDLKIGRLVGTDKLGNQYFENNEYFYGRNRWVIYNEKMNMDYDGSQIPGEWFGWMHYKTDLPPTIQPPVRYKWMIDHVENKSGTSEQYVPYSTTPPKIQAWVPPKSKST